MGGASGARRGQVPAFSLVVAVAACAALAATPPVESPRAGSEPSPSPPVLAFQRAIAPFVVVDQARRPYTHPFLGGLDAPRPQFVDIDGDGDHDLFVQLYSDALWSFENTGSAKAPRYEWRSDRYGDLEIGEWYRFVDLDADGDMDLLAEHPFSHIRHYRNTGSTTAPAFQYVDSLRDADGAPIFLDRQNVPAIVDVDCDRRLDLFIGRVEGIVARYEAIAPGSDRFTLITERFEDIEIIAQVDTTGSMRHGANALAFADFEGDGDQDLFWGDFFERGVLLIRNIGATCSSPSFQVDPVLLPGADSIRTSGYNAPVPADLDLDGDLDFAMGVIGGAYNPVSTSADNFYHWERTGREAFVLRTTRFLDGLDFGSETVPAIADLDGDGDLDLLVGNKVAPGRGDSGELYLLLNEGSRTSPRFRLADTLRIAATYHHAPAVGDLDGDGDPDLLLGTWNQDILFFRNDGSAREPRFSYDSASTIRSDRATNAVPTLADIDGDGDLDLLVGEANGEINFLRNDGTATAPRFVIVSGRLDGIDVGRRSAPALMDIDGDGLLDLVVGREEGGGAAYRNVGSRTEPRFAPLEAFALTLHPMSAPRFADLDGDGTTDVISGTVSGGLLFLRGATGRD